MILSKPFGSFYGNVIIFVLLYIIVIISIIIFTLLFFKGTQNAILKIKSVHLKKNDKVVILVVKQNNEKA